MDGGRTLRMIAESAVSRNYLRGSITTVYGLNDYGVTVVGPTVHDAFDELFSAERTTMYQITAMSTGGSMAAIEVTAG